MSSEGLPRLVDSHAHLEEISDLAAALARARERGVAAIVAVGSEYESNSRVLEIAAANPGYVYPALGLHPGVLHQLSVPLDRQLQLLESALPMAVAVGEVGLDYHKRVLADTSRAAQHDVFRDLLSIAGKHGKPVIVHSRYAWRDSFLLARESKVTAAVFHWYTGPAGVLQDILQAGFFISATVAAEYHAEHRRAVRDVPLEKLLLETDCPVAYRGQPSEPADVTRSLAAASAIKGVPPGAVADATTRNAGALFGLFGQPAQPHTG